VLRGLERLERQIGWEAPTDEIRNGSSEGVEENKEGEKRNCAKDGVGLRNLSPLLELIQNRILGQLLIELLDIVTSLVLGLEDSRVGLEFLSGRHLYEAATRLLKCRVLEDGGCGGEIYGSLASQRYYTQLGQLRKDTFQLHQHHLLSACLHLLCLNHMILSRPCTSRCPLSVLTSLLPYSHILLVSS